MKAVKMYVWLCLLSLNHLSAQTTVSITGTGFLEYAQVSLKALDPQTLDYQEIATTDLKPDHAFKFQVPFTGANLYQLNFEGKESVLLSVEKEGLIKVARKVKGVEISGSPASLKIQSYRAENEQLQAKYFGSLKQEMDQAMAANDEAKLKEIQQQAEVAVQNFLIEFREQIEAMGVGPAGYYAMQFSDFNKELAYIESRLAVFQEELPDSPITRALEKQVYQTKNTAIGRIPPTFNAKDQHGQSVKLEDLRGKWVLVDFWAAWCRACRVENPELAKVYEDYRDRDFVILSVSQDKTRQQWLQAIEKDGIGAWPQIWDQDGRISELYSVSSLPQNVLLDQNGAIIAKNLKAEQVREMLLQVVN